MDSTSHDWGGKKISQFSQKSAAAHKFTRVSKKVIILAKTPNL